MEFLKLIKFETHFYRAAVAHEFAFVAQVAHEEKAATAAFFDAFAGSRVRNTIGVESGAFVGYPNREGIFLTAQRNGDTFVTIGLVAVENGVGDCFGKAYENIPVNIGRKVVAGGYVVYERLYFGNVVGV